ncbi:MAG: polysaccharide deacetylase family protein [Myxococcales bacterium]|nr:polysaccharide deacetylase family protein [Myxococcales bacterium]
MTVKSLARGLLKRSLRGAVATIGPLASVDDGPRILCYHGVSSEPPDEWSVTPAQLTEQMAIVCGEGSPVSLTHLVAWLLDGTALPERAIAVTFDDGYQDVYRYAAPILAKLKVPATAFVITGLCDGLPRDASYVPSRPTLTWDEVLALHRDGWTIGSHTLSHPILSQQSAADSARELSDSRRRLSEVLGHEVTLLAYPYGTRRTVSPRDHRLAEQAGYQAAFLDAVGSVSRRSPRFALPRCKVLGTDSQKVFRASLCGQLDLWRRIEDR